MDVRRDFENLVDAVACIHDRVLHYKKARKLFQKIKRAVQNGTTTWKELRTSEEYLSKCLEMVNPQNGFIVPPSCSMF